MTLETKALEAAERAFNRVACDREILGNPVEAAIHAYLASLPSAPVPCDRGNEMKIETEVRDSLEAAFAGHYWDSLETQKNIVMAHVRSVLATFAPPHTDARGKIEPPSHADLMVTPESLDEYLKNNPLPAQTEHVEREMVERALKDWFHPFPWPDAVFSEIEMDNQRRSMAKVISGLLASSTEARNRGLEEK